MGRQAGGHPKVWILTKKRKMGRFIVGAAVWGRLRKTPALSSPFLGWPPFGEGIEAGMRRIMGPAAALKERRKRFRCPCCMKDWVDIRLVRYVEEIEEEVGSALEITSGYRCEGYNLEVGGFETSSHLKGLAVNLGCEEARLRWRILKAAIELGINRIGIGDRFVHVDIDRLKEKRVVWLSDA